MGSVALGSDMLWPMNPKKMRLHLVHGTWAKGFRGSSLAWSEAGHQVYRRLSEKLPENVEFESFVWSGRNSVAARAKAVNELQEHLGKSLRMHPEDCHLVLAHSHGGTIANEAVRNNELDGHIRGLICLATPFVYLVPPTLERMQASILAMTSVMYAIYWTFLLALLPSIPQLLGTTAFALVLAAKSVFAFVLCVVITKALFDVHGVGNIPGGPTRTPVFLFRGSRDEASLLLTEALIADSICSWFARALESTHVNVREPATVISHAIAYSVCLAIGVYLAKGVAEAFFPQVEIGALATLGLFVFAPAVAGLIYWLGYAIVATAAGHRNARQWLSSVIEVESAPPCTTCQIHVFPSISTSGLRHSLYEDDEVLEHIAKLARSTSRNG